MADEKIKGQCIIGARVLEGEKLKSLSLASKRRPMQRI